MLQRRQLKKNIITYIFNTIFYNFIHIFHHIILIKMFLLLFTLLFISNIEQTYKIRVWVTRMSCGTHDLSFERSISYICQLTVAFWGCHYYITLMPTIHQRIVYLLQSYLFCCGCFNKWFFFSILAMAIFTLI